MPSPTHNEAPTTSNVYVQIPVDKLDPAPWNPNKLPVEFQVKLEEGIKKVLEQSGRIPPITVRKHPDKKDRYQIIDGFHRTNVFKKLHLEKIDAFVLDVDDSMARILTAMLNYIRGEADPEKYPILIAEAMAKDKDLTFEGLAKLLPETEELLVELVESSKVASELLYEATRDEADELPEPDPERWVVLNFNVPLEVAGIVEKELDRIGEHLTGKNRRMRALEYIAVNSALTPLDDVVQTISEHEQKRAPQPASVAQVPGLSVEEELKRNSERGSMASKSKRKRVPDATRAVPKKAIS